MNQTLLVEILTEELPPKSLLKLSEAFAAGIVNGLKARDFLADGASATTYATPRRLAVSITQVRPSSPDKSIREKVLPVQVALDAAGEPAAPLAKKLAAMGFPQVRVGDLERARDGKTESFFYTYTAPGCSLHEGLQAALEETVGKLPIPRLMSYQRPDGVTVQFVRPAHKLIALHGATVVPVAILGLAAGIVTLGHRFLSQGEITVEHAESYPALLEAAGKVIVNGLARKEKIRAALLDKAGQDKVLMPEALLDEVAALVEWPVVYECNFEPQFLSVPQECLILTMQTNQKYFALTDSHGKLRPRFLIVSNIETVDPQHIIGGNERVVRPRLSDAKFFFEQDKKTTLENLVPKLANVVYHNKLGSLLERTERVKRLAGYIAKRLSDSNMPADLVNVERAARLSKADLLTEMVAEFPELQGLMGRYYAQNDREHADVAQAIEDHYRPRYAGDKLAVSNVGLCVALADKLETLVGIFSIGLLPSGDKDPFALRRHALGVIRMLVERKLPLNIRDLAEFALRLINDPDIASETNSILQQQWTEKTKDSTGWQSYACGSVTLAIQPKDFEAIFPFMQERLRSYLRELGYTANEIEAVVAQQPDLLDSIVPRLQAVRAFTALPEAAALAAANKRIGNILKKACTVPGQVDQVWLREASEQNLYRAIASLRPAIEDSFAAGNYTLTLTTLAGLRADVDDFFDHVMVNADDPQLRGNRLALLSELHLMMNRVADISKLAA